MKRQVNVSKLVLKKSTVAHLDREHMRGQVGGAGSDYCTEVSPRCQTLSQRDCPVPTEGCGGTTTCPTETCYCPVTTS